MSPRAGLSLLAPILACRAPSSAGLCETPLAEQIENAKMLAHLEALQSIADAHDGTRATGTPGYDASVEYVHDTLDDLGYVVRLEEFEFERFVEATPSVLEQVTPTMTTYENGAEFATAQFSGSGDVTAAVSVVDLQLGLDNASTSGCEPADFDGFSAGDVALIQRGECPFVVKVENAAAADASAVLIFNQGDTPDRVDLIVGTLGSDSDVTLPVLFTEYALGEALAALVEDGVSLHLRVDGDRTMETANNVLADGVDGDPTRVVMLGAHLDSVPAGPGINDNGSGTAMLLHLAERVLHCAPSHLPRFAWWGAEEYGLIGSSAYVAGLAPDQRESLAVYLNFDMVASPNFTHFVYDADGSSFDVQAPPGSAALEGMLREQFGHMGIEPHDAALNGRSDYWGFMQAGVAVGGTFTGAEGIKTAEQSEQFGGEVDAAYDACYHTACDTVQNVAVDALEQNARVAAGVLETLAGDLSALEL